MKTIEELTNKWVYAAQTDNERQDLKAEMKADILALFDVSNTLPNKDDNICEGYNKAKMQDYKNRNVLRHKDQDDYYSGWMDCYDWISKGN